MREWLAKERDFEPARVRAVVTALIGLLAALGISLSAELTGWLEATLVLLMAGGPLVQGEVTRSSVVPVATLEEYEDLVEEDGH